MAVAKAGARAACHPGKTERSVLPRRFAHPRAAGDTRFWSLSRWMPREVTFASVLLGSVGAVVYHASHGL